MDPKPKINLDPKLKEAYDGVMGIKAKPEAQPSPAPPIPPDFITKPNLSDSGPQIISQPPIFSPQPVIKSDPIPKSIIVGYNSPTLSEETPNIKFSWRWTLITIIILILLLVYFFFWAKLLEIKIPFLS